MPRQPRLPASASAVPPGPEILTNTCAGNPYGIVYYDQAKGVARANTCKTDGTSDIGIAVFDDAKPKLVDNDSDNNLTATETV